MNGLASIFGRRPAASQVELTPAPLMTQLPVAWLALLGLLIVALPLGLAVGIDGDAGLEALRRHHLDLVGFVAVQPIVAALLFMIVFAVSVAISLPGISFLTLIGGFLFGWMPATIFTQVSATLAAAIVFLLARRALAQPVETSAGPAIRRFTQGFKRNAFGYVVFLNLVPVFPFGMVIALPAACGVRLRTFVAGGFLGILPGTILLTHLGSGLGTILRQEGGLHLASFLSPQILLAVGGLAVLSLLPLAVRHLTRRQAA